MAVDRSHFNSRYRHFPAWKCPTCRKGILVKKKSDDLLDNETGPSARAHSDEDWDPEWVNHRFAGLLTCNHATCGELVAISGRADYEFDIEYDDEYGSASQVYTEIFEPKCLTPAPWLFVPIKECPDKVRDLISDASALYWVDFTSAGNKLRSAVEVLLNDQKIPTFSKPQAGKKRVPLTLHARIDRFSKKNKDSAELLMAIKWLGNAGSHFHSKLKAEDVLQAADFLEAAIVELYKPGSDVLTKAKKVNKKKGP